MKATVLAISALLLGFQASAQQNIGTENAAIERQAPLPAIEPQPDEPGAAMLTGSLAAQPRLRMYPVPTFGTVTADCPQGMLRIEVRDLHGIVLLRNSELDGVTTYSFDIGRPGQYLVDVTDRSGRVQHSRFLRQ
jgi:hypothetical protein